MDLVVLNTDLESISILDKFESLIWTDRHYKCGDFEILVPFDRSLLTILQADNYVCLGDKTMIIETINLLPNSELGTKLMVKGRSLESILDRRIVWGQTILNAGFQEEIERLLTENVIDPINPYRKINRVVFSESTDPNITELAISGQYMGDYVYDVISTVCEEKRVGFKITLNSDGEFVFSLYSGQDRSYDQIVNPYVAFSPKFETLASSDYKESKRFLKTTALVVGEGDPSTRLETIVETSVEPLTDLTRREMFEDAGDLSRDTPDGILLEEVYLLELAQRGKEKLLENDSEQSFDGTLTTNSMYKYGVDFFMGDIVQIEDEFGLEKKVQVTEFIRSEDSTGFKELPIFETII